VQRTPVAKSGHQRRSIHCAENFIAQRQSLAIVERRLGEVPFLRLRMALLRVTRGFFRDLGCARRSKRWDLEGLEITLGAPFRDGAAKRDVRRHLQLAR